MYIMDIYLHLQAVGNFPDFYSVCVLSVDWCVALVGAMSPVAYVCVAIAVMY